MRKYEEIHVCPDGGHGKVAWDCTCDPGEGETVTTYDARDVQRALRDLLAWIEDARPHEDLPNEYDLGCRASFADFEEQVRAALAAFTETP